AIVSGTFLDWGDPGDGYASYIDLLMETGAESGVSPLTLASMILVEQGPDGASDSVSGAYGYYNFFNINAYASGGLNAVQNGLIHAELQGWDTPAKSIKAGAAWYYRNFISCGQYTLYLKKFNVLNGLSSVGKGQYMTNVQGARAEGVRLSHGFMDAGSNALTFDIPVYYGMTDYPAPEPGSGDNIDFLSLLAIEDHELKPSFSPSRTEYSLTVPNETEAVTILAEPASPEAYVTGDGYAELAVGENDFTITCTSSTGESRSYTITIIRKAKKAQTEETEPGPETDPGSEEDAPSSETYDLSGTLLNYVLPETTAGELLAAIDPREGSASIRNAAEEAIDADTRLATGMTLVLTDSQGAEQNRLNIVVKGDNNGDGRVNSADALRVQRFSVGTLELDEAQKAASDLNGDGRRNSADALLMQRYSVGAYEIQ
ncbi:MAG: cadherin-like beta sandwich domain-containing protein, partial [Firmicutes bacterium]|nr:cadherin-like beta sandwich domain-containing protein [Bacillota bacterium]